jgi:hypothetical protein
VRHKFKIQDDLGLGGVSPKLPKAVIKRRISNLFVKPATLEEYRHHITEAGFPLRSFNSFLKRVSGAAKPLFMREQSEEAIASGSLVEYMIDYGLTVRNQPSKIITLMEQHDYAHVGTADIQDLLGCSRQVRVYLVPSMLTTVC